MASQKIYYTAIIFLGHFTFGVLSSTSAATMIDFVVLLSSVSVNGSVTTSTIKEVSYFMTFSMLGAIAGSFVSFLYKSSSHLPSVNRQLFTSGLLFLFGVAFALTPRFSTLVPFYGAFFVIGLGGGNWNTVSSTWLMELHEGQRLAAVLQLLQLCYGLGMIVGPVVVSPFLSGYIEGSSLTAEMIFSRRARLTVPYVICGAVQCAVGLILFLLYLLPSTRYSKSTPTSDHEDLDLLSKPSTTINNRLLDSPNHKTPRFIFSLLVMTVLAFYNLAEVNHLNFQTPYYQSLTGPNISASTAAEIASMTATSYTAGRGLSVLTASWLSSAAIISGHLTLALVSFLALLWVQYENSVTLITVNSVAIGLAFSAVMPAIFSYVNTYLTVDDRRNAAFFITLSLPSVFSPLLLGSYLQSAPSVLLYLDLGSLSIAFLFFALSYILVAKTRREGKNMAEDARMLLKDENYQKSSDYGSRL